MDEFNEYKALLEELNTHNCEYISHRILKRDLENAYITNIDILNNLKDDVSDGDLQSLIEYENWLKEQ